MRVGLVGDSQGVGMKGALANALRARGDELVWSQTLTGASLRRLAELAADAPRGLDLVVIVSGGGNDDSSAARWPGDVRALLEQVRARAPRDLVWAGPMPARDGTEAARRKLGARAQIDAALGGVRRIDGFELARDLAPSSPDGVHFSAAAYRTMAERLALELRPSSSPSALAVLGAAAAGLAGVAALAWAWRRGRP